MNAPYIIKRISGVTSVTMGRFSIDIIVDPLVVNYDALYAAMKKCAGQYRNSLMNVHNRIEADSFATEKGERLLSDYFEHITSFKHLSCTRSGATLIRSDDELVPLLSVRIQSEHPGADHPHHLLYLAAQAKLEMDQPHIKFMFSREMYWDGTTSNATTGTGFVARDWAKSMILTPSQQPSVVSVVQQRMNDAMNQMYEQTWMGGSYITSPIRTKLIPKPKPPRDPKPDKKPWWCPDQKPYKI